MINEDLAKENADRVRRKREVFEYMRSTLSGLRKAHVFLCFTGGDIAHFLPDWSLDGYADIIMDLVSLFAPALEVDLFNADSWQHRVDIVNVR